MSHLLNSFAPWCGHCIPALVYEGACRQICSAGTAPDCQRMPEERQLLVNDFRLEPLTIKCSDGRERHARGLQRWPGDLESLSKVHLKTGAAQGGSGVAESRGDVDGYIRATSPAAIRMSFASYYSNLWCGRKFRSPAIPCFFLNNTKSMCSQTCVNVTVQSG